MPNAAGGGIPPTYSKKPSAALVIESEQSDTDKEPTSQISKADAGKTTLLEIIATSHVNRDGSGRLPRRRDQ
jgi:hypothetical protein